MVISYLSIASLELAEAVAYYDEKVYGLGERFLSAVIKTEEYLLDYPEIYSVLRWDVRQAPVPNFPYSVLYQIDSDEIIVLAVMYQGRKPDFWYDRV